VITINGNDYRLVLLDTNALSEFAKQGDSLRHFLTWSSAEPMFVPCFSLFSVLEMRRRPDVFGRFKELFAALPCMLVKSHEQLLEDEVRHYPDPSGIDPRLLGFSMLGGEGMDLARVLERASENEFFRDGEKYWNVRRLTPVWMGDFVIAEVARVAAVADSTDYLTERSQTEFADGTQETLTIQHRLSGSVDIQRSPGISRRSVALLAHVRPHLVGQTAEGLGLLVWVG
jgi:hypothetical protein